jgi:hypothetical protein
MRKKTALLALLAFGLGPFALALGSEDLSKAGTSGDAVLANGSIPTTGGHFFEKRLELPVADFAQDDPRWGQEHLGPTTDTLADEGCTLTSVVMVLNYYKVRCDPSLLNHFLASHGGYDEEGLLDFERVVEFAPDKVRLDYQGDPSYDALDRNLLAGHPVIVQLTLYGGYRHFVVVMGKQGYDYLVRDPAAYPAESLVTLKSLAPKIEQQYVYRLH